MGSLFSSSDTPFTTSIANVTLRFRDNDVVGVKIDVEGVVGVAIDDDGVAVDDESVTDVAINGVETFFSGRDLAGFSVAGD